MKVAKNLFLSVAVVMCATACIPQHLQKYMNKEPAAAPASTVAAPATTAVAPNKGKAEQRPSVYAIGENIFRFNLNSNEVWDSAINVLLTNYNITTLDRESGLLTTEWDTFYLEGRVYRNKISMHLRKSAWNLVDVIVYNNVETLSGPNPSQTNSGVWLPTNEGKQEIGRIVQNMALYLKQPKPNLPEEMIARSPQ
ncbi:MAG: hypothetical protein AB7T49_02805 [Oligoflexales bacterium]